jgi:hypothetical protein
MTAVINITVVPGKQYKITAPAGVSVFYAGVLVGGSGALNTFIATSVNQLTITSSTPISGNIVLTEILKSYYNASNGGTWAYKPGIDKWTSQYSFTPEWMSMVGNRLLTFRDGIPYVHNSATFNQFYGTVYDSVVSMVHSEAGLATKIYESVSIEGDTPDIVHVRTEVPYVQSSDLRASDFVNKEGVKYAPVLRDRLSPNVSGTFDQKVFTGDVMRGEVALFQGVFLAPSTNKLWKFVNLGFIPSRGHNTQNTQ